MKTTIWHNPRCSKSRQTLALLEEHGVEPVIRLYLEEAPTVSELKHISKMLGKQPSAFIRTKEPEYKDIKLGKNSSTEELFIAMAAEPKLIERPIVIHDGKAALGRPPEAVLTLFK